jgi:hypothetical protein
MELYVPYFRQFCALLVTLYKFSPFLFSYFYFSLSLLLPCSCHLSGSGVKTNCIWWQEPSVTQRAMVFLFSKVSVDRVSCLKAEEEEEEEEEDV